MPLCAREVTWALLESLGSSSGDLVADLGPKEAACFALSAKRGQDDVP